MGPKLGAVFLGSFLCQDEAWGEHHRSNQSEKEGPCCDVSHPASPEGRRCRECVAAANRCCNPRWGRFKQHAWTHVYAVVPIERVPEDACAPPRNQRPHAPVSRPSRERCPDDQQGRERRLHEVGAELDEVSARVGDRLKHAVYVTPRIRMKAKAVRRPERGGVPQARGSTEEARIPPE